jgi:fumarylacetoacetase
MFRPDQEPLLPNWRWLPVAYHGRAGSVVVTGTDVVRPRGQRKSPDADAPTFGPSRRLDFELELGFVVGVTTALGETVPTSPTTPASCFNNDWRVRDIQVKGVPAARPQPRQVVPDLDSAWDFRSRPRGRAEVRSAAAARHLAGGRLGLDIALDVKLDGDGLARQCEGAVLDVPAAARPRNVERRAPAMT